MEEAFTHRILNQKEKKTKEKEGEREEKCFWFHTETISGVSFLVISTLVGLILYFSELYHDCCVAFFSLPGVHLKNTKERKMVN